MKVPERILILNCVACALNFVLVQKIIGLFNCQEKWFSGQEKERKTSNL